MTDLFARARAQSGAPGRSAVVRAVTGGRAGGASPYQALSPIRVAVLGSCVSRDLFNSRFNPGYKKLFDCVALSNQVSLISLMSQAVDVPAESVTELDEYGRREVTKEVTRSFLDELIRERPDYLLMDMFADVHFGCFSVDGRYLTRNRWKIMNTRFYAEADKRELVPEADYEGYLTEWRAALDRLLVFLGTHLPDTKLVLHRARNVTRTVAADGTVRPHGRERQLLAMNDWWARLDQEVTARGVDRVIDLFTPDLTSADAHPWGPFAVHYTLDYHPVALAELTRIVLSDARRDAASSDGPAPRHTAERWVAAAPGLVRRTLSGRRSAVRRTGA